MLKLLWQHSIFVRAARSVRYLASRSKISLSALFLGATSGISVASRVTIGPRSRLKAAETGAIIVKAGVWISSDVEIETEGTVTIGDGTTVQRRCTINGTVSLGKECILAPNVFISSGTHPFRADPLLSIREQERRIASGLLHFREMDRPITIGDDCWFGANVVVCPGVVIGNSCVIGANSVVTRDLLAGGVYAGVPAKKIGDRS
ncbi:hypothetical protein J5277_11965 [Rhizobium sp. 16-449-1b]|uniref:acyltransferase n=1 Tax=Rhizobium sp. 16-449-1b TaxID=2819989 RepID=UPI001ADBA393|nr:hypothetical protein [Rhizobium sp. 16-449-1b]